MKKHLIAAAVAAAVAVPAMAQNVSITGIMDAMYLSGKHFGQSYQEISQSGARTTSVQVIGSEDLGGGLKANFRFEVQPSFTAGDGNGYNNTIAAARAVAANGAAQGTGQASAQSGIVGKGYSFVGLSGNFGAIEFGTINSPSFRTFALGSGAFGTGIGSGYGVTVGSTGSNTFTRFENAVMYQTPTWNGLQIQALTSLGNDSQWGASTAVVLRRQSVRDLGLSYTAGPFNARAAYLTTELSPNESGASATAVSNLKTTTTTLAASYDFGVARLGALVSNVVNNADAASAGTFGKTDTDAFGLNVTVPMMTSTRLIGSIHQRKTNENNLNTTGLEGRKTSLYGIGAEYDVSKRTFLYARYESGKRNDVNGASWVTNGAVGAAGTPADSRVSKLGLGVSHQF